MQNSRDIKATLDSLLLENNQVFIVPHKRPDFDAIASSIGMSLICQKNNKRSYIVIDDEMDKLESETRKMIESIKSEFEVIMSRDAKNLINDKSLMIAVDTNKEYLIPTEKYLKDFNNIFVLDHHKTDSSTIHTPYLFTDDTLSSASEEVSRLLFLYDIKLKPEYATYLLAGIILDTNKLSINVSKQTYEVAGELTSRGASPLIANNMFLEDFEHDRAVQKLVDNTDFPAYIFAIACDNTDKIYEVEDIAKAADYLLKYRVNITFAIAKIDENTVSISARSKGDIDASRIMKLLGGGGNQYRAAAKVKGMTPEEVKTFINNLLVPTRELENISLENATVDYHSFQNANVHMLTLHQI